MQVATKLSLTKPLLLLAIAISAATATWHPSQAADAPVMTLKELMNAVIQTSATELWNAALIEPAPGANKPALTDQQWEGLRSNAVALLGTTTTLLKPDLKIAEAGKETPSGELSPDAIAALRKDKWQAWQAQVSIIEQGAKASLKAIDEKDYDALLAAGDPLYAVCESCHQQFWYPQQAQ
jgi:hypothetical protein